MGGKNDREYVGQDSEARKVRKGLGAVFKDAFGQAEMTVYYGSHSREGGNPF